MANAFLRSGLLSRLRPLMLAPVAVIAACSYHPSAYEGDGTMYAMPVGSPRYDLELAPIDLTRSGRTEYQLSGLPTDTLQAVLVLEEPTPEQVARVDSGGVRVGMTLTDHKLGRTSSKQGSLSADWGVTPESWAMRPVEFTGIWFKPERRSEYTLVIEVSVSQAKDQAAALTVIPHVRGGLSRR